MLTGSVISLRPVADTDLETLHRGLLDSEARGAWYPLPRTSLVNLRRAYEDSGFWSEDTGILLIVDDDDRIAGFISWERLNSDVPDVEIGYRIFAASDMGRGMATEALTLLAGYLFAISMRTNRLRLTIHVDNAASRRLAEKAGFTRETTSREGWFHNGRWHDVDVFVQTRAEHAAFTAAP